MQTHELPVHDALPDLVRALSEHGAAVLVAPPGAGKTTVVPPALLDADLAGGRRIVLLQPRRVAARAAARQMARLRGWRVGDEVGYHVRFDRRIGRQTRIEVLTEGLLTRQLQADPLASDLGLVILDEFHERSVHADMALAMLAEVRREVRPDLRLLVMSATLDAAPVAAFLGDCPVVESAGRPHPVTIEHIPPPSGGRVVDHCAAVLADLLRAGPGELVAGGHASPGHILAFLPGMGEIRRVQGRLGDARGALVLPLHGSLPAEAQDRALMPSRRRKVVLATNVAETSLTIEGVRTVVDSGLARSPRFDPGLGLERLETIRIPRASADQRAGRAGRTGPGRCIRLWSEPEDRALAAFEVAEIRRTDLCRPLLEILAWGGRPRSFGWFEAPEEAWIERAEATLRHIGALDERGLTSMGRALASLPVHPRLGRVLLAGHSAGRPAAAAAIAALASERDIFREPPVHTGESDLDLRLQVLEELEDGDGQAAVSRRWGLDPGGLRSVLAARRQLAAAARAALGPPPSPGSPDEAADHRAMLLAGFPDRVGRLRPGAGRRYQMVGGHGAALHPNSAVRDAELIVAIGMEAGRRGGTHGDHVIRIAAALDPSELVTETRLQTRFDASRMAVVQHLVVHHHGLTIAERPAGQEADQEAVSLALAAAAQADPERAFALDDETRALLDRVRWLTAAMPELGLPPLAELGHPQADTVANRSTLIEDLCAGRRSFAELRKASVATAIRRLLGRKGIDALAQHAPPSLPLAAGGQGRLTYQPGQSPVLCARIQHLFGTTELPRLAGGRQTVLVHLLAPNGRPAQVTSDLAGFWTGAYQQVRRELRGRYPKHAWPEAPTVADGRRRRRPRRS